MDSSEFSSQITDRFPEGIRVLVVDDDLTWLKILEKMLKKCNYQVTACSSARDALELLRERKDGFEIVMCDANMPDMDGFQLLERVGNMNLPIIMMSVDGKTSRVMKGIQRGACDYLLKPIRMKEIQNIWQHVFRKRMNEERDIGHEKTAKSTDCHSFSGDISLSKKRKETDNKNHEVSSRKKARVVWTVELHQKFVKALDQIGLDKAGPKKIFELMGEPWLTRENVASHLQKYRLYLSKSQRQHEQKVTSAATMHSDIYVPEPVPSVCLHNSIINHSFTLQQNVILDQHSPVVGYNPNNDTQICEVNEAKGALLEFEPQFQLQHQLYHLQPPPIACIGGGDKPTLVHGLESTAAFFAFQQHQGHNNIAFEGNQYDNLGCSFKRSSMMGNGCAIRSSDEGFIGYPSHGDLYLPNHGNASLGSIGYMGQDLIQDIAPYRVDFNYGQQHPTSPWNTV